MNPSRTFIVVNNPRDWSIPIPGLRVVSSRSYLTDPYYIGIDNARIFNLCRSYDYQSRGYYVSLLATARGQKVYPSVNTLQKMKTPTVSQAVTEDLEELIQKSLKDISSKKFSLSIYFGKNLAKRYDALAIRLFNLFDAPLLRAHFIKRRRWELRRIGPISDSEIPFTHREFVVQKAVEYFHRRRQWVSPKTRYRYDLAILVDPKEKHPPSNTIAIKKFIKTAESMGINADLIHPEDLSQIGEYDGLFIRCGTQVNNFAFQFAVRAEAKGLAVIDDSESIIRCTNKVFLAEALKRAGVDIPHTLVVHEDNMHSISEKMWFPIILKKPDSSFSMGVKKINTETELKTMGRRFFENSELIIAQEFIQSQYDWRIGMLDGKPLYACKYFMANNHWQILKKTASGRLVSGKVKTLPIHSVPQKVITTAVKAAATVGRGLYGVDIKISGKRCVVIEVNDNPNLDAGFEDAVLKKNLYRRILESFVHRIEALRGKKNTRFHP